MDVLFVNGSSRGNHSNTKLIIEHVEAGVKATPGNTTDLAFLYDHDNFGPLLDMVTRAEGVVLAFPLRDGGALPATVRDFLTAAAARLSITDDLAATSEQIAARAASPYVLLLLRGGADGPQALPGWITSRVFTIYTQLGKQFGTHRPLDPHLVHRLVHPPRLLPPVYWLLKLAARLNLTNPRLEELLRTHRAFSRKYHRRRSK
jgi:hypothetical protein